MTTQRSMYTAPPRYAAPPRVGNPRTTYSYWYLSPAADIAITRALMADGRRRWDPRHDSPSLATLAGKARQYGGRYAHSRARLMAKAGVRYGERYAGKGGRLVRLVRMPGERWSDTGAPPELVSAMSALELESALADLATVL